MEEDTKKAADDTSRKDAEGEKLDKVLAGIDSFSGAMDALTKRMDSIEEEMRKDRRKDDDKKDDAKCDDKKADARRKDDDDKRDDRRKDEEEEGEKKGEPEPVAADRRKDARRKDDDDKRDDIRRKDEEEHMRREDRRKDDDDDDKRDDAKRADSVDVREVLDRVRDLERKQPKPLTDADYDAMAAEQARADSIFAAHGERAPRPLLGETPLAYRRRLVKSLQSHSTRWKDTNLTAIADSATLNIIQDQVYADAKDAARHPSNIPAGQLIPVVRPDSMTGHKITEFRGSRSFVRQFKPVTRRVTALNTRFDR